MYNIRINITFDPTFKMEGQVQFLYLFIIRKHTIIEIDIF
jgi:uncharacterized membrane protein YozB (DUF420 family)